MLALALLFGGKNAFVIGSSGGNHVKNDACPFVGGSRDPGRPSPAGAHLAIKRCLDRKCSFPKFGPLAAGRDLRDWHFCGFWQRELSLRSSYFGGKSKPKK